MRAGAGAGALTLPAQAAASSSPRHRATSCTLGSSCPSRRGLPSAPKSWEEGRAGVLREQSLPRVSTSACPGRPHGGAGGSYCPELRGVVLGMVGQPLCPGTGQSPAHLGVPVFGWVITCGSLCLGDGCPGQRHSRRWPCSGPGGAGAPARAAAAAGTTPGPAPSSPDPAAAPPAPAPAPSSASAVTQGPKPPSPQWVRACTRLHVLEEPQPCDVYQPTRTRAERHVRTHHARASPRVLLHWGARPHVPSWGLLAFLSPFTQAAPGKLPFSLQQGPGTQQGGEARCWGGGQAFPLKDFLT